MSSRNGIVSVQVHVGDVWVGVVWACILISLWLQGKICVGEWCCEVVGSCEVQQGCDVQFSTSLQPDQNLCVCVCSNITDRSQLQLLFHNTQHNKTICSRHSQRSLCTRDGHYQMSIR